MRRTAYLTVGLSVAALTLGACTPTDDTGAIPTIQPADPGGAGQTAAPGPDQRTAAPLVPEDLPPVSDADLRLGLALSEGPTGEALVDIARAVDETPGIVLFFKDFEQEPPLHELDVVAALGAEPVISWEPWVWGGGVEQPDFRLSEITSGRYDDYLTSWGTQLATWGKPVTLRFAHEMNGNWYPWGESANGNAPGDYVAAYRHVHDVVTAAGAENVRWMWSPNVLPDAGGDLSGFYPGDDYVDVVGVDGYNWGTTNAWNRWQEPEEIFDATLDHVRDLAPGKELVVAETASVATGGDQAVWVRSLVSYLHAEGDVTGFVWLHEDQEDIDWRLQDESLPALKEALAERE